MSARILIVDDEATIRESLRESLAAEGYEAEIAESGEEALAKTHATVYDLVVTDLQMPRLNGLELIERIRANPGTETLPVILLTAKGFELTHQETYERYGVFDVVPKPFSPRDLCNRVQMALEDAARRSEFQPAQES